MRITEKISATSQPEVIPHDFLLCLNLSSGRLDTPAINIVYIVNNEDYFPLSRLPMSLNSQRSDWSVMKAVLFPAKTPEVVKSKTILPLTVSFTVLAKVIEISSLSVLTKSWVFSLILTQLTLKSDGISRQMEYLVCFCYSSYVFWLFFVPAMSCVF